MIGKLIGAATGAAINKEQHGNPLSGAAVGFVTMAVARRFLPARFAAIGATLAAGYLSKKLAELAERRDQTEKAIKRAGPAGVADSFALLEEATQAKAPKPRKTASAAKRTSAAKTAAAKPAPHKRSTRPTKQTAQAIKVPEPTG
jgi:hypothetical protein